MSTLSTPDGTDLAVCQQVEVLCKQLYESQDSSTRLAAEKALVEFSSSPDCLNRCKLLMDRADSPYSQVLAASTLTKLIGRPNIQLPVEERLALRNYILQYLAQRGPKLPNFVSQALVTLFGRITKLGWYDFAGKDNQLVFRDVTASIFQFLQEGSAEHSIIGIQVREPVLEWSEQKSLVWSPAIIKSLLEYLCHLHPITYHVSV